MLISIENSFFIHSLPTSIYHAPFTIHLFPNLRICNNTSISFNIFLIMVKRKWIELEQVLFLLLDQELNLILEIDYQL